MLSHAPTHPNSVFDSIATTMFKRARDLCTDEPDKITARHEVIRSLEKNGYANKLIKRTSKGVSYPPIKMDKTWLSKVVLPHKKGTSEIVKRLLEHFIVRVIYKPNKSIGCSFVEPQDTISKCKRCNSVYPTRCAECDAEFIEQTSRELKDRITKQRRLTKKLPWNKIEYDALVKNSAIACHALDTGHKNDFDDVKMLWKNLKKRRERLVAETLEIKKSQTSVNRLEGLGISDTWMSVIKFAYYGKTCACFTTITINFLNHLNP